MKKYEFTSRKISKDHILLTSPTSKLLLHRYVLFEYIGYGPHQCHWCKEPINWNMKKPYRLVVDHIDGNQYNNDRENLVASCDFCNNGRHWREKTECLRGHPFDEENTLYHKRTDGGIGRRCRTCDNMLYRIRYQQKH